MSAHSQCDENDFHRLLRPPRPTPGDEICKCVGNKPIKLMCALSYNPLHCIDCNLEIAPESLSLSRQQVEAVAAWRSTFDSIDRLWLTSGAYEDWALKQLEAITSPVNLVGTAVREAIDPIRRCYYWLFQDESAESFQPATECPRCLSPFSPYRSGIFPQFLCENCSVITVGV